MPSPSSRPPFASSAALELTPVNSAGRARALSVRTERPRADDDVGRQPYAAADLFDRACTIWGQGNVALAEKLGVSESIVRDMRAGHRVVTLSRLLRCPAVLVAIVLRLLAEEKGIESHAR